MKSEEVRSKSEKLLKVEIPMGISIFLTLNFCILNKYEKYVKYLNMEINETEYY